MRSKLLITGTYNQEYPRNKALIESLGEVFEVTENNFSTSANKIFILKNLILNGNKYDYILFLQTSQKLAFLLFFYRLFFKPKKIKLIFDAFISIYDTYIFDRALANRFSVKALYYYLLDYFSCLSSDIIIFDTNLHRDYFIEKFHIKERVKKIVIPISIDLDFVDKINPSVENIFDPKKCNVLFFGLYIPLQGVEYIIKAADILREQKDMQFILIGNGQTRKKIDQLYRDLNLDNIIFIDRIENSKIISYIKLSSFCLGIFGNTNKAKRVIANKVLECLACKKIVVTGRNRAIELYLEDKKDLIYCEMADAKDLAEKIKYVSNNLEALNNLGENGRRKIEQYFSKHALVKQIKIEFSL
ncbi:MAG: Glycosyl transferase group 1 [Parcubacteria group bacterium GW2011_GWA2_36_10]|nr:MAG: Glycosyl transferase group 1 [Parcubacteria group bacterium GW2011_GWA2_36_10]